jgi:DinB superfamily
MTTAGGPSLEYCAQRLLLSYEGPCWHGPSLGEALQGVSAIAAAARPVAGAHSIWELAAHVAAWNEVLVQRFRGETPREMTPAEDFPAPPAHPTEADWQAVQQRLRNSVYELHRAARAFAPEKLSQRVPNRDHTFALEAESLPDHLLYHAGQIALLKKAPAA